MTNKRPKAVPTLQLETDKVIVTEWKFAAGAETTWHTHGFDYIVVPQTTGPLLIESDSGEKISELTSGQSYSRDKGIRHNVVNPNDFEFVFVEIELK